MTLLQGRYALGDPLRRGGMAEVYHGTDTETGNRIAIKMLKTDLATGAAIHLERFRQEGALLRQLDHPNIVKMLDAFQHEGRHVIVMELVAGGSLRDMLHATPRLPIDRVLWIALDLADALTRAHRLDIIHRDLKPANVLIAEDGTPRLTDFGISQLAGQERFTGTGRVTGTPRYLSPEAIDGQRIDARADIWAFGVLLFEMLAGRVPFEAELLTQVFYAILHEPVPDLEAIRPDAPVGLVDLIYRMLEKDPRARIPSVRIVGTELEALLRAEDMVATVLGEDIERHTVDGKSVFVTPTPPSDAPQHNLPVQTTVFVGREDELAEIARLLADPGIRLVTILGPGGMGKTRLALEVAEPQAEGFERGAWFVPLAALSDPAQIVPAIAEAIDYQLPGQEDTRQQLLDFLRDKALLLVLDNFEHLLDKVGLVNDILRTAPQVKVLATSRARLNLSGETVFALGGMDFPDWEAPEDAQEYAAVKLFMSSARRVEPGFELQIDDMPHMARICRLVGGLPLGIVLAAAWIDMLSLEEIAREISHSLDFLDTDLQDIPDRHRSMRALFESIWGRLDQPERDVFMKLSVFRGGFTRRAAQAVTGVSLRGLTGLANKSLLRRDPHTGRYEVHELLRQYGAEQLDAEGDRYTVRDAHSEYYLEALAHRQDDLAGQRVDTALDEIASDIENAQAAWIWALEQERVDLIMGAQDVFGTFFSIRGRVQDAIAVYKVAVQMYDQTTSIREDHEVAAMQARARNKLGHLYTVSGAFHDAQVTLQTALAEAEGVNDQEVVGRVLANMGSLFLYQGEAVQAIPYYESALGAAQVADEPALAGIILGNWATAHCMLGEHGRALELLSQQVELRTALGDRHGTTIAQMNIGVAYAGKGDYPCALDSYLHCLNDAIAIGDQNLIGLTMGNIGQIYALHGKYEHALLCLNVQLSLGLEVGDRRMVCAALAYSAKTLKQKGDFAAAERAYGHAITLARAVNRYQLCDTLYGHADLLIQRGDHAAARPLNAEAHILAEELSRQDLVFDAEVQSICIRVGLGKIDIATAITALVALGEEYVKNAQQAALDYARWQLDPSRTDDRQRAAALYRDLFARTPKIEYGTRYHELTGDVLPAPPELPPPPALIAQQIGNLDAKVQALIGELRSES